MTDVDLPPLPSARFEMTPTESDVAFFVADGFVSVPRITTDEEVEWLGVAYDLLFEQKVGVFAGGYFDLAGSYDAGATMYCDKCSRWSIASHSSATAVLPQRRRMASALLGADEAVLYGGDT